MYLLKLGQIGQNNAEINRVNVQVRIGWGGGGGGGDGGGGGGEREGGIACETDIG